MRPSRCHYQADQGPRRSERMSARAICGGLVAQIIAGRALNKNITDRRMLDPTVMWDLKSGHLDMMTSHDEHVGTLAGFAADRNKNYEP